MYQRHLKKFLKYRRVTPNKAAKWDKEKATSELLRYMGWLKREEMAPKTRGLAWHALRDFFRAVGKFKIDERIPVKTKIRVHRDIIPTKEQLRQILDHSPIQGKLGESLMAFSGLSPADCVRLTYDDFKEYFEGDKKGIAPAMLTIRRKKTGEEFITFVPKQTLRYLEEWLQLRRKQGEEIKENTHILRWNASSMTHQQSKYIRRAGLQVRKGFRLRNYSLRKYFRRGLLGKVDESLSEFFMGHNTDLPGIYAGLVDLDPEAIKKAREEYLKALPDLQTEGIISPDEFTGLRNKMGDLETENQKLRERLNGLNGFLQVFKDLSIDDFEKIKRMADYVRVVSDERIKKDIREYDRAQRAQAEEYLVERDELLARKGGLK